MNNECRDVKTPAAGTQPDLSDFALFLSVMKNKEAHEITLGIIMEKPDLQLEEIHVEQVVLNKSGKRAIRLDAWAKDIDGIQYNTEMQNDLKRDDVRKRARFYQGLMDTPVLKSGKETKYRQLPSTVIIFITQDDIFGEDLAKYTFTEQCEEVEGLHLDDGTTKIFLNMTSKNGAPELISLLQYMKETSLSNPNIIVKDERIKKLDSIVNEVLESEEWEETSMSIYSVAWERGEKAGMEAGMEAGMQAGMQAGMKNGLEKSALTLICKKLQKGKSLDMIADEMETGKENIMAVFQFAKKFAPEYDPEIVLEAWLHRE